MASLSVVTNSNSSLISAIRNLVCPLCGASMMGFRCLGYVAATGVRSGSGRSGVDRSVKGHVLENRAQGIDCRGAVSLTRSQ